MNNEFINKGEAVETALQLSKKNSNYIYVNLSGCGYFVTDSDIVGNDASTHIIAKFKKGKQVWPIPEPDLPVPVKQVV